MKQKKLELLLSKLDDSKKDAFLADLNTSKSEDFEALLSRYGIVLTENEKAFLTAPVAQTLADAELDVVGGQESDSLYEDEDGSSGSGC